MAKTKSKFDMSTIKDAGMGITFAAILFMQVAIPAVKDGISSLNLTTSEKAVAGLAVIGVLFSLADAGFNALNKDK